VTAFDYPVSVWNESGIVMLTEGMIYNKSEDDMIRLGQQAAAMTEDLLGLRQLIGEFIKGADGEYLITLWFEESKRLIVFNDFWGRLPVFYHQDDRRLILSRDFNEVLNHMPVIRFDRPALAEWLTFEYTLDSKTLIRNARKMEPGAIIEANLTSDAIKFSQTRVNQSSLDTVSLGLNRKKALSICVDLFMTGLEQRVHQLRSRGYALTVDLSGGFDSRAVLVGLRRLGADVLAFTDDLPSGDESEVAAQLARVFETDLVRIPGEPPVRDLEEMRTLTFLTGGAVNCSTAVDNYNMSKARRRRVDGKAARFMGFGGEFIRHPYAPHWGYHDLAHAISDDLYTRYLAFDESPTLVGLGVPEFSRHIGNAVGRFPELSASGKTKRLYLEYYRGLVNAGEDRHRRLFWVVSPFWASHLVSFELMTLEPQEVGYSFFTEFLHALDPRAATAPIYGEDVNLESTVSRSLFSGRHRVKNRLRNDRRIRELRRWMGIRRRNVPIEGSERAWLQEQIRSSLAESSVARSCFDEAAVQLWLGCSADRAQLYQLLTAILQVSEVSRHFKVHHQ
jgi:hypothetical protein